MTASLPVYHKAETKPTALPEFVAFDHPNEADYADFVQHINSHDYSSRHMVFGIDGKLRHPWQHRITGDMSYSLNGVKGDTLLLFRGYRYFFSFRPEQNVPEGETQYPLFFTTDPVGGGDQPPVSGMPSTMGKFCTVSFIVGDDLPHTFYYQSARHEFMGGIVHILGKPANKRDISEISQQDRRSRADKYNPHLHPVKERERIFRELDQTRGGEDEEEVPDRGHKDEVRPRQVDQHERDVRPTAYNQSIYQLTKKKADDWVDDKYNRDINPRAPKQKPAKAPIKPTGPPPKHRHQEGRARDKL